MRYCLYVFQGDEIIDIVYYDNLLEAVEFQMFWNDPDMQDIYGYFIILRIERSRTNATV